MLVKAKLIFARSAEINRQRPSSRQSVSESDSACPGTSPSLKGPLEKQTHSTYALCFLHTDATVSEAIPLFLGQAKPFDFPMNAVGKLKNIDT